MASLRELRDRIRSVNSTKKITKAQELIATSRITKAQAKVEASLPYAQELSHVMERLASASSLDHPMQGGFLYFCYTHIAGVRPTAPGFARFSFAPCRTRGIDSFEAEILAPTGKIYADGCRCESLWRYSLDIPVGSVCTLDIAGATHISVNGKAANTGDILGSGKYCIEVFIA